MSEEEREVVKKFERLYLKDFNNEKIINEDRLSYIECALMTNLIEKLQKENEELKENNNKYTIHLANEQYNTVIENAQNDINQKWIRKVKDKIDKLKDDLKYIACENKNCNKCFSEYRGSNFVYCYAYHQIKVLNELLESEEK
jgi:hypothetical protein